MSWNRTAAICLILAGVAVSGCNDASTVVVPDTAPPMAPDQVKAYIKSDGWVVVRWAPNAEPDLAGYNIYQLAPYALANQTLISSAKTSCVLGKDPAMIYRVTAVDFAGNESAPSKIARVSSSSTPTTDPTGGENLEK
jgi:hypothetical protein